LDIAAKMVPAPLRAAGTILGGFGVFKGVQIRTGLLFAKFTQILTIIHLNLKIHGKGSAVHP
jgi:hypothetical protein